MKYIAILSFLTVCLLVSCKKKTENVKAVSTDAISHVTFAPNAGVSGCESVYMHPSGCGMVYYPSDTMSSFSFDVNDDGIRDFTILCFSWYDTTSTLNPCDKYNSTIDISSTAGNARIAYVGAYRDSKFFNQNQLIDNSSNWLTTTTLMTKSYFSPYQFNFNGDVYLGVKILQMNEEYFGWIHLNKNDYKITVYDYAINWTSHNPIRAGQIE